MSSSVYASDAEQVESVGRRPSMSASATDSSQQTSVAVDVQREASKSSDVSPVNSQLQPTDSTGDETTLTLSKSESSVKPGLEHLEATCTVDADKQASDTADACIAEDVSKPPVVMTSPTEASEGKKASPDLCTNYPITVEKEATGDVDSPVKTRGKSRVSSRSVSSSVDAAADLESSGVESASESGKMKAGVEDKMKTARAKKKHADEDISDKSEKRAKVEARKPAGEDKAADDEGSNEDECRITVKVKEEETAQKSRVPDLKEKDKPESESDDQKGKGKDSSEQKAQKSHGTRKGSLSITNDSARGEKRSRVLTERTDPLETAERTVGRGRRKVKVGPSDVVLSEAENSQEPEQYGISESSDSAATKLESKTLKHETAESSSFEGLSVANEFSRNIISDAGVANVSAKEPCYKADVCENSSETTNSGAAAGTEPMSRADVVSLLTAAFTDSPAYTSADELGPAGGSSSSSAGGTSSLSPAADADEEHTSTKSELEANMEVAAYMGGGGGSTNEGELSSDDDDDDDSSSLNTLSRKPSVKGSSCTAKRKSDDGSFQHSGKRRQRDKQHRTRSQHASSATKSYSYGNDGNLSL